MTTNFTGVLYVVVCGAGPAGEVGELVTQAQARGWRVCVIATPAAMGFVDAAALERQTGRPVRHSYRVPGEGSRGGGLPRADAIVVAPATFNTVNKWAQGISDTYALGLLAEAVGLGIPTVVLPFVNQALAAHFAFRRNVEDLRAAGVRVLLGPGEFEPHPVGAGGARIKGFPWTRALEALPDTGPSQTFSGSSRRR